MTERKNLIFERAGGLKLTKRDSSGRLSKDAKEIYISNERIVQSIGYSFSKEANPIDSGNSNYPVDIRVTKIGSKVDIGLNAYDRQLFRFGMGATLKEEEVGFIGISERYAIPQDGVITLENVLSTVESIAVKGATDDILYTMTDTVTKTGEYKVDLDTNTITFDAADAGKSVLIYAEFVAETTSDIMEKIPKDTTYQLEVLGKVGQIKGATDEMLDHLIFDSVKFSGELKPPQRTAKSEAWTVSFELVEPTGNKAMEWKYAEKAAIKKFAALDTVLVAITETNSIELTVKDSASREITSTGGKFTLTVGETYTVSSVGYVDQTFVVTVGMTTKEITLVTV